VVQLELISAHRFDNSITPQLQDLVCRFGVLDKIIYQND